MRLKELRKERKMLQRQVAKAINCSQAVYSRYENGEREPSKEILASLADLYGVSVDYLLGREDASPRPGWIKITPNMAGEAGIIPEGVVRVGNVSRTFAESAEARQFKASPEVVGHKLDDQWRNWGKQREPLVLDGDPPTPTHGPETQEVIRGILAKLAMLSDEDRRTAEEHIDFMLARKKGE